MATGFEGVGEAVTGGLLARAVEPEAGEGTGEGEGLPQLRHRRWPAPIAIDAGRRAMSTAP